MKNKIGFYWCPRLNRLFCYDGKNFMKLSEFCDEWISCGEVRPCDRYYRDKFFCWPEEFRLKFLGNIKTSGKGK